MQKKRTEKEKKAPTNCLNVKNECFQAVPYLSLPSLLSAVPVIPAPSQSAGLESLLVSEIRGTSCSSGIPTGFIPPDHYASARKETEQKATQRRSGYLPEDTLLGALTTVAAEVMDLKWLRYRDAKGSAGGASVRSSESILTLELQVSIWDPKSQIGIVFC